MDNSITVRGVLIALLVAIVGGVAVYAVQWLNDEQKAVPSLVFKRVAEKGGVADILTKSESSRPFPIVIDYRLMR
jgi:hypothetical protein